MYHLDLSKDRSRLNFFTRDCIYQIAFWIFTFDLDLSKSQNIFENKYRTYKIEKTGSWDNGGAKRQRQSHFDARTPLLRLSLAYPKACFLPCAGNPCLVDQKRRDHYVNQKY